MNKPPKIVQDLTDMMSGDVEKVGALPDGSGFATVNWPLPKDHWLYEDKYNVPPMPFRCGTNDPDTRNAMKCDIVAAARYAVRCATMNGKVDDFDPDALVQNMVVGMLGYYTPDGFSENDWANPPKETT